MVGRKPAVSPTKVKQKILEFEIYTKNKTLKNREDDVWKEICKIFDNKINSLNLFKMVEQDRHNIRSNYNGYKGFHFTINEIEKKDSDDENEDFDISDIGINNCESTKKIIHKDTNKKYRLVFDITLTNDQWETIKPIQKLYKSGRKGQILKDGWTDIIRKAIWDLQKLPCIYSFERYFIGDDYMYIKIEGHCTDCKEKINVICEEKPIEDISAKFTVITTDCRHIPHSKKIRLQKSAKSVIEKELLFKKPKQWRRDTARQQMEYGDPEPPHLYTLSQLQNARQNAKNKELGIKRKSQLFDSLTQLKNNVEFNRFIKDIGYDPFFLLYWSAEQTDVYNDILLFINNAVSLDAVSSITLKINRPDGNSSDIFLSIMCTHIDELIVAITQALSEKNESCFYRNWLEKWIQSGGNIPKEIVTDMGKAIQNGSCLAFNSITFKVYKDICLMVLFGETSVIKMQTQLRIDIAHLIHAVTRWPCFTKDNPNVKRLFVKCIGFMTAIEKLEIFQKVLKCLFIVAYSRFYDKNCQTAITYLISVVQTFEVNLNVSRTISSSEIIAENERPMRKKKYTLTQTFIAIIKNDVNSSINNNINNIGMQTNDYYLPDFGDRLIDLSKDFVCWTNVMTSYFKNPHKVPISARSEAHFGDLKAGLENIIVRADKFAVKHMRNIDADMKLARAAINKFKINKEEVQEINKNEEVHYDIEHLMVVERWRNKYSNITDDDHNFTEVVNPTPLYVCTKSNIVLRPETIEQMKVLQESSLIASSQQVNNTGPNSKVTEKYMDLKFASLDHNDI